VLGFLNVDKPRGPTSHDVVAGVRRLLRGKAKRTKVGHAGTLDPFADGVLVVCVGAATRLAEYVQSTHKRYAAEIILGATSTTDDPEGNITQTPEAAPPDERAVREAAARFVGVIRQAPPAHSAVHVAGRRAYKLARGGEEVALPARRVEVHSLEVVSYAWPAVRLEVCCGAGTYIRALARDLGRALGVGAYCSALTRTEVGPFTLEAAVPPGELRLDRDLVAPREGLRHLPAVTLDPNRARSLRLGQAVEADLPDGTGDVLVLDEEGGLIAVGRIDARTGRLAPAKVFPPPAR
jgi:tRNA pseudouridine55 synthase